jgi:hypothetical protein
MKQEGPPISLNCFPAGQSNRSNISRQVKTIFQSCVLIFLGLVVISASFSAQGKINSGTIGVTSNHLHISFHRIKGQLAELTDLKTKMNFVQASHNDGELWKVDLLWGSGIRTLTPSQAKSFRWEARMKDRHRLRLIWEDFGLSTAPDLRVEVSLKLDSDISVSRWKIKLENLGKLVLEKVRFPRVMNISAQPDERLAVPVWMGQLSSNPRETIFSSQSAAKRLEWSYPGTLSLQCLAFYRQGGPGLYLSCDDTAAFRKAFGFWGGPDGKMHYEMSHLPESERPPSASYSPAYHAIVGTFEGDWITAAERYRAWATEQAWARESRLNKGLVPDWLLDTGIWVWNRGGSEKVLQPAAVLQKELGLPVRVLWHWWHGCAYDIGFPEYFPPREGTKPFKEALQRAHQKGIKAIVYMNQRLWGMTTRSWQEKGAQRYAVKTIDGSVRPEVYNIFTGQPCASMCIGTHFWRKTYADLVEEAVRDLDVDGIYMDQACSDLPCYDPNHGHSLGGGRFWMDGFRMLSGDIRKRTSRMRNVLLAGEGSGEAWLPYLDLMLTLQVSRERYETVDDPWEVIPFFQAVYHPYSITYGNYSSLTFPPYDELWPAKYAPKEPLKLLDRKFSKQFFLEQARAFVWGLQPTIANFNPSHLLERPEEINYLIKLARIRYMGLKYLQDGMFLRSPVLNVPAEDVDISRLSIYAGQKDGKVSWQRKFPAAIVGTWKAKDGNVGIAIASISNSSLPIKLQFATKNYGLEDNGVIYRINENGRKRIAEFKNGYIFMDFTLPPRGAGIVELIGKH